MSLRVNPIYEKLLPQMSSEEFEELKMSIQIDGQHYPIIANEDLEVLDGHHRYRACSELDLEPDFEVRKFENKLLEKKFVIESNLRRRHLTSFQLVELGIPLLEIEKAMAKKRQTEGGINGKNIHLGLASPDSTPALSTGKATAKVAEKLGISTRTFERGKKIFEKATEEEKQKLREGKTSISKLYHEIIHPNPNLKDNIQDNNSSVENSFIDQNKTKLLLFLKKLESEELFCPSCGSKFFECASCHTTLQNLLK
ncbi:ParB N-terminal domain-containing protein [Candidatus Bathyarchaeota archaeon]|nr:ParB N-terminal domain-containing protein [Candidatus Bathyarchaeota archaeon]